MKATDFKRGDKVVYCQNHGDGISLTEATVTVVAKGVVHTKHITQHGWECKEKFGERPGNFQENPRPLWRLRKIAPSDNLKNLQKRAKKATQISQRYRQQYQEIQTQVENEAREWKYREIELRAAKLAHGGSYLDRVLARMGFKRPKK